MYAESQKASGADLDIPKRLILEVYIPIFSVLTLLAVTLWILHDSIIALTTVSEDDEEVDVIFLYCFSAINFFIDAISTLLFYIKGKDVLMYMPRKRFSSEYSFKSSNSSNSSNPNQTMTPFEHSQNKQNDPEASHCDDDGLTNSSPLDPKTNVNMISALTHVTADTLRSISVFVSALISTVGGYSSTLCDAWASIFVIITIFIAVIPLSIEIYKAYNLLR